jgi:hypothetical protein
LKNEKNEAIYRNFIESIASKATARRYNEMLLFYKICNEDNLSDFLERDEDHKR